MPLTLKEKLKRFLEGLPPKVKIGKQYVGEGEPVFIIAEVGINHNGDLNLAQRLIDAAKDAGADAVKFQKRTIEEILTKEGLEKPYNSPHAFAPTYGEHRKKLEFSEAEYTELRRYADERSILFFASVWDEKSADFMERLNIAAYKIPSADVINTPLLEYVAQKDRPVLVSTGMSTLEEIDEASHAVLAHNGRLVILHCLSLYPSPEEKINLRFMDILSRRYRPLPVGYSGHEMDFLPTIAAVARGASVIERHITLDRNMKGSDHAGSLEPAQFKELVSSVRRLEKIMGRAEKILYDELVPLREKLSKSITAKVPIRRGTIITADMLAIKGPGKGIKPSLLKEVIGRRALKDLEADTHLPPEALAWPY